MESETHKTLPFLDVLVTRKPDGTLGHQVYRKPTHTDRYLNNLEAELEHVKHALIRNGFPARRFQHTINRLQHSAPTDITDEPNNGTSILPYIAGTTDRIAKRLKREGIKTVFKTETKIGQVLTSPKDPQPSLSHTRIYKIPCSCGKVYIEETGRSVSTRLIEHSRCTRLKYTQSAVAEHQLTTGHTIQFEEAKILTRCKDYFLRKYRESIEILKHPNNINRDRWYFATLLK
ncbi:uncharacterized protein LOC143174896 [Nomia melanderi]|uniref:uncharacterized protein LOC143174896 n=1 Tax=Nomia melanderi TaxID=2448451 RepID=UPI003FCCE4AC